MKLHQINDVETFRATSLQSRTKHIFIKKLYNSQYLTVKRQQKLP